MAERRKPVVRWQCDWGGDGTFSHPAADIGGDLIEADVICGADLTPMSATPAIDTSHGSILLNNPAGKYSFGSPLIENRALTLPLRIRRLSDGRVSWQGRFTVDVGYTQRSEVARLKLVGRVGHLQRQPLKVNLAGQSIGGDVALAARQRLNAVMTQLLSGEEFARGRSDTGYVAVSLAGNNPWIGPVWYRGWWLEFLELLGKFCGGWFIETKDGTLRLVTSAAAVTAAPAASFGSAYEPTALPPGGPVLGLVYNTADYVAFRNILGDSELVASETHSGVAGRGIEVAYEHHPSARERVVVFDLVRPIATDAPALVSGTVFTGDAMRATVTPDASGDITVSFRGRRGTAVAGYRREDAPADNRPWRESVRDYGRRDLNVPSWQTPIVDADHLLFQRKHLRRLYRPPLLVQAEWSEHQTTQAKSDALRDHAVPGSVVDIGNDRTLIFNMRISDRQNGDSRRKIYGIRLNDMPADPAVPAFTLPGDSEVLRIPTETGNTPIDDIVEQPPGEDACIIDPNNMNRRQIEWRSESEGEYLVPFAQPAGNTAEAWLSAASVDTLPGIRQVQQLTADAGFTPGINVRYDGYTGYSFNGVDLQLHVRDNDTWALWAPDGIVLSDASIAALRNPSVPGLSLLDARGVPLASTQITSAGNFPNAVVFGSWDHETPAADVRFIGTVTRVSGTTRFTWARSGTFITGRGIPARTTFMWESNILTIADMSALANSNDIEIRGQRVPHGARLGFDNMGDLGNRVFFASPAPVNLDCDDFNLVDPGGNPVARTTLQAWWSASTDPDGARIRKYTRTAGQDITLYVHGRRVTEYQVTLVGSQAFRRLPWPAAGYATVRIPSTVSAAVVTVYDADGASVSVPLTVATLVQRQVTFSAERQRIGIPAVADGFPTWPATNVSAIGTVGSSLQIEYLDGANWVAPSTFHADNADSTTPNSDLEGLTVVYHRDIPTRVAQIRGRDGGGPWTTIPLRSQRLAYSAATMTKGYDRADPPFPMRTVRQPSLIPGVDTYNYAWLDTGIAIPNAPTDEDMLVFQVDLATQRDIDLWVPMRNLTLLDRVDTGEQPELWPNKNHLVIGSVAADPITSAGAALLLTAPATLGSVTSSVVGTVSVKLAEGTTVTVVGASGTNVAAITASANALGGTVVGTSGAATATTTLVFQSQAALTSAASTFASAGLSTATQGQDASNADVILLTEAQAQFDATDYALRFARGGRRRLLAGRLTNGNLAVMATVPSNDELDAMRIWHT